MRSRSRDIDEPGPDDWPIPVRKTRDGLAAARARGRTGGRPRVVDTDKRRIILARHADGESIRATKVSVGTVHKVLVDHRGSSD
jgi:DNA invertase Pin-like site-specific DNA recombinase